MMIGSWKRWDIGALEVGLHHELLCDADIPECSRFSLLFDAVWEWLLLFDGGIDTPIPVGVKQNREWWRDRADLARSTAFVFRERVADGEWPSIYEHFRKDYYGERYAEGTAGAVGFEIFLDYLVDGFPNTPIPKRLRCLSLLRGLQRLGDDPSWERSRPLVLSATRLNNQDFDSIQRFWEKYGSTALGRHHPAVDARQLRT